MRILGFEKHWPKLDDETFSTFRYPRRDTDWIVGERVQVVIKPRSKGRQPLLCAEIIEVKPIKIRHITEDMARRDGFKDRRDMMLWLTSKYRNTIKWIVQAPMNRLILREVYRYAGVESGSRTPENASETPRRW